VVERNLMSELDHIVGQLRRLAQRLEEGFPPLDAATLLQAYAQEIENLGNEYQGPLNLPTHIPRQCS
jgi:hypothetical protein